MLTGLKLSSLTYKCVNFTGHNITEKEVWTLWNWILKVLKWRNEIYQRIELKEKTEKSGVSFPVIMFTPQVIVIKMSKMTHFLYFRLIPPKSQSQYFDKIFICIWKILFSSLRKCYGLLNSELPLARYQPLKIQSFIIFFADSTFFWYG